VTTLAETTTLQTPATPISRLIRPVLRSQIDGWFGMPQTDEKLRLSDGTAVDDTFIRTF